MGVKTYDNHVIGLLTAGQEKILTKFTELGDTVWTKHLGNDFFQRLYSIDETDDNNIVLGGHTVSLFDENGNQLWDRAFTLGTGEIIDNGCVGANGNGVLYCGTAVTEVFNVGTGYNDYFASANLVNLDSNGDTIWTSRLLDGLFNSCCGYPAMGYYGKQIYKTPGGDILVYANLQSFSTPEPTLWKLDANGNTIFFKTLQTGYMDGAVQLADGGLAFYSAGSPGVKVVKVDTLGNMVFSKTVQLSGSVVPKGIVELSNGNLAIGLENVTAGSVPYCGGILVTNDTLEMQFGTLHGGNANSQGGPVFEYNDGGIVHFSSTNAFTGIPGSPSPLNMVKIDSLGSTIGCHEGLVMKATLNSNGSIVDNVGWSFAQGVVLGNSPLPVAPSSLTVFESSFSITDSIIQGPCFGDQGTIDIEMDGQAPYSFTWSNGLSSEDITDFVGTYEVVVVDNYGCVITDTFSITQPTPVAASYTSTHVDCFGASNGSIDLTVTGGTPGYTYDWTTLNTTEDLSNLSGGFYQCIIMDTNGCDKVVSVAISEPQQLVGALSSVTNASCFGDCDGQIIGFGAGGTSPYTYLWNDPSAQTNDTISNLCYGSYLMQVSDTNGCVAYSNATINQPLPLTNITTTWSSDCFSTNGSALANPLGGTGPYTYVWDGAPAVSNDSIGLLAVANYYVDVIDANGCMTTENFTIGSNTNPVEICVVTVDSNNQNLIVWEKPVATNIAGFNIFRNIAGIYTQVGYQPYDSISQYVDNDFGIDPEVTSYRYKIAVLDSCGNESELSSFHETIHLTASNGLGGVVNLIWDDYEGFPFSEYEIWRDTTGNGDWETINTVLSTSFTYVDNTVPASATTLRYAIEVVMPQTCTAEKAQDHNTTRSNRHTIAAPNPSSMQELILSQANVYPNPNEGIFTINVKSTNWSYSLLDMSGKLISTEMVSETNKQIDMQTLETGIYLMKINLGESFIYKKVIKQ